MPGGRRGVVLVAHPSADRYGSDRMLLESVAGLVGAGRPVVVTVPADGPLTALVREVGADVVVCPAPRLSRASLTPRGAVRLVRELVIGTWAGARLLRRLAPEVVYVSTVTVPWWLVLARLARVPAVVHVHEAEASSPRAVRTALTLPLLLARSVVANSRFTARTLVGAVPRLRRRTTVVPNGVAPPPRPPAPPRRRVAPPVRLLYVGRLSHRKGVDVAVRAVRRLRDTGLAARLDVVGEVFPGYEPYREELERLVAELGLVDEVTLHGYSEDVWAHVARSDVVVVPSRLEESFGNTAVEALLGARPVVASRSGGLVEAVEGCGAARLVPPGDAGAVADAVRALVGDWERVREDAVRDASLARERRRPELYRDRVVAVVDAVARGLRPTG